MISLRINSPDAGSSRVLPSSRGFVHEERYVNAEAPANEASVLFRIKFLLFNGIVVNAGWIISCIKMRNKIGK